MKKQLSAARKHNQVRCLEARGLFWECGRFVWSLHHRVFASCVCVVCLLRVFALSSCVRFLCSLFKTSKITATFYYSGDPFSTDAHLPGGGILL